VIFGRFRPNNKLDAIMRIVSRENKIVYFFAITCVGWVVYTFLKHSIHFKIMYIIQLKVKTWKIRDIITETSRGSLTPSATWAVRSRL
jgi:hypothetical protein